MKMAMSNINSHYNDLEKNTIAPLRENCILNQHEKLATSLDSLSNAVILLNQQLSIILISEMPQDPSNGGLTQSSPKSQMSSDLQIYIYKVNDIKNNVDDILQRLDLR